MGQEISDDTARIGREMVRIKDTYRRKVNVVARYDLAFRAVLDSQQVWHDLIGQDLMI